MKSAVVLTDAGPRLELSGEEWIYPVTLEQEGADFKLFFHMSPYAASEMKSALLASMPRWKRLNDDRSRLLVGDSGPVRMFFDSHFLRISGADVSLEEQKAWLNDNENIKSSVIANAMAIEVVKAEENGDLRKLPQLGQRSRSVSLRLRLVGEIREPPAQDPPQEIEILTIHHFAMVTAHHYAKYERQAIQLERNDSKKELAVFENYDVEERFYDELIEKVEGALINGQACELENKQAWIKAVPFRMKSIAIDDLFRRVRIKNV
jgi:hypothetical protein